MLKIAVSLGILAYIFLRVVDINLLWKELIKANPLYFVAAVMVYFLVQGLSAWRWYVLLKPQALDVPFSRVLAYYFLGMYFNFFLPSAIGGDVVKVYYLNKETKQLSASASSVFFDRDIGMGGLVLIALVTARLADPARMKINGVPLVPIFALIAVGFLVANLALFYRPTYNLLHRLLSLFKMKKVDDKIERLFTSVNVYRRRWGLIAATMVMSLGVQVGCAIVNLLAARSIGINQAGLSDFLVFIPAIGLISMIPISVGGTGLREASYILMFSSVGVGRPQALALSVLWLGVIAITSLPGGIVYVARGSGKADHIPADVETLEAEASQDQGKGAGPGAAFSTLPEPAEESPSTV
ncbi:MAG TPA: lysylphosphatidylglycerol synthase transmembrane domain-containing protein [Blastocatellia bacterium]